MTQSSLLGQDASDYFSFFPDTQVLFARKLGLYQGNVSGHMVGTLVEPESLGVGVVSPSRRCWIQGIPIRGVT